jgi:hypothetical protein
MSMDTASERLCRYCQQRFEISRFHRQQQVCANPDCQKRRRADYHRDKRQRDSVYGEVCRDSQRKWRTANPTYQQQYRRDHPAAIEANRTAQRQRDQRRKLGHLVKNNLALDLTRAGTTVYLVGPAAADLVKNTLAQSKLLILQPSPAPAALLDKNTLLASAPVLPV